jgi:hypothetical protein
MGILLRSRAVQTYLANRAAQYLEKELGCTVSLKSLEFDLVQNIHAEGIFISDQQGDSMICIRVLDFNLRKWDRLRKKIDFIDGEITGGYIRVGHHKGVKGQNIDFLVDYINGPPKKKSKAPSKPWAIYFGNAKLKNTRFHYFDDRHQYAESGIIDEYHLEFNEISGTCRDLWLIDDSLHFTAVNLETRERSGLQIDAFNAVCNIHYKGMDFDDLTIKMPCSFLSGDLHFSYPGYKYLDEFISNTEWKAHLQGSHICLDELSIFDESLRGHKETLAVEADISGTFDKLRLKNAQVTTGVHSLLKGDLYFEGLPDWQTMYCEFDFKELKTHATDLERLITNISLPVQVSQAGVMTYTGNFKGQLLDFTINGNLQSEIGNITADGYMNFEDGLAKAQFAGQFSSESLQMGTLLSAPDQLGNFAFKLNIEGEGLTARDFQMTVNGEVPSYQLMGRSFTNARVNGTVSSRGFEGETVLADPSLNIDFGGIADFSGQNSRWNFIINTHGTDLSALGIDTAQTLVYGNAMVDIEGLQLRDMHGTVSLNNISVHRSGQVHSYTRQQFAKRNQGDFSEITATGDALTGFIRGKFDPANILNVLHNEVATILSRRFIHTKANYPDSFAFSLQIPQTGLLSGILHPSFNTTSLQAYGMFDGKTETMQLTVDPMDMCWGQFSAKQLSCNARKEDKGQMEFNISAAHLSHHDSDWFNNLEITGTACQSDVNMELKMKDARWNEEIDIVTHSEVHKDSVSMHLANSRLELMHNEWQVAGNAGVTFMSRGRIQIHDLYLESRDAFFEVNGILSDRNSDTLHVDAGNFSLQNLSPLFPGHLLDSLKGRVNARVYIASVFKKPRVWGDFSARNLEYRDIDYGDLDVGLNDNGEPGRLGLSAGFVNGPLDGVSARGSVAYDKKIIGDQFDVKLNIPSSVSVKSLQPFLQDIVTLQEGKISGNFHLGGDADKPELTGNANIKDAYFKIDYLNTFYRLNASIMADETGFYTFKPARIVDETGKNYAWAKLAVTHRYFDDWNLDLRIDSARNLKVLNTTEKDNSLYYGVGFADGNCRIYGPFDQISMDINLKTRKNTQINLMYSEVEETSFGGGHVKFRVKGKRTASTTFSRNGSDDIYRINLLLEATPEAEAQFVIDKKLGDVIRGRGAGNLRMLYDENEHFFLYGNYVVSEGDYVFSLPGINVLTRKIALDKGGVISWDGDPYNVNVSMTGSFEKKISPSALMASVSSTNKDYPATRIVSQLRMKGNLFSPEISFDLQAPDLQAAGGSSSDVFSVIQRIRSDKDETMRQAVALLLFGNFIPPSFATGSGTGGVSGSGVAGSSLSGVASSVVNDIFSRLGIPTRIQVNIDDVRSATGTNTKVFINSEWFLTDRLRLDVNYDPTVAMLVSNVALPLNFNLEYMTRNENWRVKAFSRSNNLLLQQNNSTITNGVSGNTLGGGLIYRREFNTLRPGKKP